MIGMYNHSYGVAIAFHGTYGAGASGAGSVVYEVHPIKGRKMQAYRLNGRGGFVYLQWNNGDISILSYPAWNKPPQTFLPAKAGGKAWAAITTEVNAARGAPSPADRQKAGAAALVSLIGGGAKMALRPAVDRSISRGLEQGIDLDMSEPAPSEGLSPGAKVGIGIGVGVLALVLILAVSK